MFRPFCAGLLLVLLALTPGCKDSPGEEDLAVRVDTLENGAAHLRYPRLPENRVTAATPDLRLGAVEGEPNLVFGDVRGVDADGNGTIYVLDYLASEIRAFDSTGAFLHLVARRGEGPGEIGRANGMILVGDTILWIQNHSQWTMIGVSPEGGELSRVPMHVRSYGYLWEGTVDNLGRIWRTDSHFEGEDIRNPQEGFNEHFGELFLKSYDMATASIDSVTLGGITVRYFVEHLGNATRHIRIPFLPERIAAVDPDGGFWQTFTASYQVARLNEKGDTIVVIEVDADPVQVQPEDRTGFIDQASRGNPALRRGAEEVAAEIPEAKPIIQSLSVDDQGRLWVQRTVRASADPRYDVFDREGVFLGSVELSFEAQEFRSTRIRHGKVYAVVLDEWDAPSIVRAKVPEFSEEKEGES